MRNVLTRALGAEPDIRIDHATAGRALHDRYLLCSDGVHGALRDASSAAMLDRRAAPEADRPRHWWTSRCRRRIGDNATALVLDVLGLPDADRPI